MRSRPSNRRRRRVSRGWVASHSREADDSHRRDEDHGEAKALVPELLDQDATQDWTYRGARHQHGWRGCNSATVESIRASKPNANVCVNSMTKTNTLVATAKGAKAVDCVMTMAKKA